MGEDIIRSDEHDEIHSQIKEKDSLKHSKTSPRPSLDRPAQGHDRVRRHLARVRGEYHT